jgi:cell division protein FtsW (lipid II flippase)
MYQQPMYQQPMMPMANTELEEPVTVGDWMLSTLILCIPIVGLVMIFVWAFGSGTKKSKANFYKASLLWAAIYVGLFFVFFLLLLLAGEI